MTCVWYDCMLITIYVSCMLIDTMYGCHFVLKKHATKESKNHQELTNHTSR